MQSGGKIGATDYNHEETLQMMPGLGDCLINGPNIGR